MATEKLRCSFGLRVDIDTASGFIYGVPRLLKIFKELDIKATFALTTGSDQIALNVLYFLPGLIKKMGLTRQVASNKNQYPLVKRYLPVILANKAIFLKSFFPNSAFLKAEKQFGIAKKIYQMGHELILHGYDHFTWANKIKTMSDSQQQTIIQCGIHEFVEITGVKPEAFAAPAFAVTPSILEILKTSGFNYCSNFTTDYQLKPFFPMGKETYCVEIPVDSSSLVEIITQKNLMDIWKAHISHRYQSFKKFETVFFYLHAGVEGMLYTSKLMKFFELLKSFFSEQVILMRDSNGLKKSINDNGLTFN